MALGYGAQGLEFGSFESWGPESYPKIHDSWAQGLLKRDPAFWKPSFGGSGLRVRRFPHSGCTARGLGCQLGLSWGHIRVILGLY